MEQLHVPGRVVRFGAYEVDLTNAELRKQGFRLRLQEQPFQILAALLEHPGEIVVREELRQRLWADGTNVDFERGLNAAVTRLRQVLSDSAETPKYIETVARRGYRFIAPIDTASLPIPAGRGRPWLAITAAVLLTLSGAVWWVFSHKPAGPADLQVKISPLTSDPGIEINPSFSPDGNQVAYTWDKGDGIPHLYLKLVGPGDPLQLTSGPDPEYSPAWSRDGHWIAFLRTSSNARMAIFVVPSLGGAARKVTDFDIAAAACTTHLVDWTPDGAHLIVSGSARPGREPGLFLVSVESGESRQLTDPALMKVGDWDPAVSPDGRTVAFSRGPTYSKSEIYLLRLSAALDPVDKPRQLTSLNSHSLSPAWTPDGAELVFSSDSGGTYRLWRTGITASSRPRLFAQAGNAAYTPVAGPRGRVAYARVEDDSNIWRHALPSRPGALPLPVNLISSTANDWNAQYSPDGSRIAVQSGRSGSLEVWVCASDGTRCLQLTAFNGPVTGSPRWSPDARKIAFDSAASGNFDIYVVDANGGRPQRLTSGGDLNAIPAWSRDGKWIYFMSRRSGRNEIWKVPSGGGDAIQVTRSGATTVLEAPDRKSLYYTKEDIAATLSRSNLDGTGEHEVARGVWGRCFEITADRVYFIRRAPSGEATLHSIKIATGKESQIGLLPTTPHGPSVWGLSVSPDGKYVIYSQIDRSAGDLMLVENFR